MLFERGSWLARIALQQGRHVLSHAWPLHFGTVKICSRTTELCRQPQISHKKCLDQLWLSRPKQSSPSLNEAASRSNKSRVSTAIPDVPDALYGNRV